MNDLAWGDPVNGWRLSVSLDKATFTAEEPILATIVLQNVSDKDQKLGGHGKDFDNTLDCRTESSEKVPHTLFGKMMLESKDLVRTTGGVLKSNQHMVVEVSLTRHLDLSLTGKYKLTVSRRADESASGKADQPIIISNTTEFTIE